MTRWWADPDQSRVVLGLVDDSDVEQGVGTALLAYHGIAAGVLEPLSKRTLVDVSSIRTSLDQIDLEPVAKALGRATKPIMGDASERYGELLASSMHERAVEATERLLLHLTGSGMAWPTAIERAATVHGVPLERVGKAATALGAPAIPPTVRSDIGDRALMEYAAHLGYRETGSVVEIGKASEEQEWDEAEHPRGAGGRFVNAPDRLEPATGLQARLDRFKRKRGAQQRQNVRREQGAPRESGLTALVAAMREHVNAAEEKQAESKAPAAQQGRSRADRKKAMRLVNPRRQSDSDDLSKPLPHEGLEYKIGGERFALVPTEMAQQLKGMDEFSIGRLEQTMGTRLEWMDYDTITEHVRDVYQASSMPAEALGYTVLYIDGSVPVRDGSRHDPSVYMAPSAQLEPLGRNVPRSFDALEAAHEFDELAVKVPPNMMHPNPAMRSMETTRQLQIMRVRAANENEFPSIHEPARSKKYSNPMGYEYDDFDKAAWDENEVRRDARGRFADEPDRLEPDTARIARMDRFRRKKQGRAARRPVQRKASQAPAPQLSAEDMEVLRGMIEQDLAAEDVLARPVKKPSRMADRKKAMAPRKQHIANRLADVQGASQADTDKTGLQGMQAAWVSQEDYDTIMGFGSDRGAGERDAGSADMFDTSLRQQAIERVRNSLVGDAVKELHKTGQNVGEGTTIVVDSDSDHDSPHTAINSAKRLYAKAEGLDSGALSDDDFADSFELQNAYDLIVAMHEQGNSPPTFDAIRYTSRNGEDTFDGVVKFGKGKEEGKVLLVGFDTDFARLLSDEIPDKPWEPLEGTAEDFLEASGDDSVLDRNPLLRVIPMDYSHTERRD